MLWKIAAVLVPLLALLVASGCSELNDPAVCSSGLICPPGTVCAANQDTCITGPCGNGIIDVRADEVCDDGNIIAKDGCSQDCKSDETCGNGIIDDQVGETCDDGNRTSGDGCSADCQSSETCGDGIVNELGGEQCDDGSNSENCDADCTAASCGDGFVNAVAGEQCDPPSPTCSASCLRVNCGDGIKDPGEDCDAGGVNTETCDADCTLPVCGDGLHNARAGEPCDGGGQDTAACDGDCTPPSCGDGWWNPVANEECDTAGNSPVCDQDCTVALCGDQLVNPVAGEECDDGDLVNTDECTALCESPDCTDGFQNADEIDVDCGGHCGAHSCEMLQACATSENCTAGVCLGGTCVPDTSRLVTGYYHTCVLLDTGTVRCWGNGEDGRLGYGNTSSIGGHAPPAWFGNVNVGGSVIQLVAGYEHTCALLDTDAVRCWGRGTVGRLGYGNTHSIGDNEAPASAGNVNVGGSVVQLAAGGSHTCALLSNGVVRCWGSGSDGHLGYGNTNHIGDNEAPASAGNVNVGGSVIQITAGYKHTCALIDTGAVRCWGYGGDGRLGYGNTNSIGDNETPASAGNVDVGGSVIQITAGGYHTCALLYTGEVRCWGKGGIGQLGYGNTNRIGDNEVPASAGNVSVGGTVVQLAAGIDHTCALLDTGAVRCWGDGADGRLGYGNTNKIGDNEVPGSAGDVSIGGTVIQLAAGHRHSCALLDTGAIRCWGYGHDGQLGYGNRSSIGDNEVPASAGDISISGAVIQLAAGNSHSCALFDAGVVRCWGDGTHGRLGYGNTNNIGDNEVPASAGNINVGHFAIQVVTGGLHTCALLDNGAVRCWGDGAYGQLGYANINDIGDNEVPTSAGNVNVGGTVIQLVAGDSHTCALLDTGTVRCWGDGADGRLGYGNTNDIGDSEAPVSAGNVNVGGTVIQLVAGDSHTCALLDNGTVRCWGDGSDGQLGYGNTNDIGDSEAPASAGNVLVGETVTQLAAGSRHTCALLDAGAVRCWGDGADGRLGYGNTDDIGDSEAPASAGNVVVGETVTQLAAGSRHTCALLDTGAVRCWGYGLYGQLGYGNSNTIGNGETPASAGDVAVNDSILPRAAGAELNHGLLSTSDAQWWSDGFFGQLDHTIMRSAADDETPASAGHLDEMVSPSKVVPASSM